LKTKKRLTPFQTIIIGFAGVILLGAVLLMLPFSTKSGEVAPINKAIFTATSAVCVTGLVVEDTATYWSTFGQGVILLLIQIGGLGVITTAASFAILSGRKISLLQRSTIQEAYASPKVGGMVRLTGFVIKTTFLIEGIGMCFLLPTFIRDYGISGIWKAAFHSISAFCNAGFDILGRQGEEFSSLTNYSGNIIINTTIILLIIIGGIGFLTWEDIYTNKLHFKKYRMQSKVILTVTGLLILIPGVFLFLCEFADLPLKERILSSIFQAVTPRTAGFNTADYGQMTGAGKMVTIFLMLVGGSPGSTAGGMKTTTFAVIFANVISTFQRKEDVHFFGRRIDIRVVKNATAILSMYIFFFVLGAICISLIDSIPMQECLFETASAIGTVGLTLGITPQLSIGSQCILMVLMFVGRVGGLTLIYATFKAGNKNVSKLPQEKITVG